MKKNDNKGFSLVELIIVIAIMVILVVAIAPQYLKFVNNSKISTDVQTAQSMATLIDTEIANGTFSTTTVSSLQSSTISKLTGAASFTITADAATGVTQIKVTVDSTEYECYPNPESTGTTKGVNNTVANGGLKK